MPIPLLCLLLFVVWTMCLVGFGVGLPRAVKVLKGKAKANAFPADTPHGSDGDRRCHRAHLNCTENLPLFASVVLVAAAIGHDTVAFDNLAWIYLGARVLQSIVHMSSGRSLAVNIRFSLFTVQIAVLCIMSFTLIGVGLG